MCNGAQVPRFVKMSQMPQEIEVWYVLPAIRKELVAAMKKEGLRQKDIAERLGISEPAVSQYVSSKRAAQVRFSAGVMRSIAESAKAIAVDRSQMMVEVQRLMKLVKDSGELCKLHHRHAKLPKACSCCIGQG